MIPNDDLFLIACSTPLFPITALVNEVPSELPKMLEVRVAVPLLNHVIATVFYPWLLCVSTKFSICVYPILKYIGQW